MDYVPFSNDGYDNPAASGSPSRGLSRASATQIILFCIAVVLSFGAAYWFISSYPDKVREILITVDRFGITEVGAKEQNRVYTINRMAGLNFEEREVLINRTVFLGASTSMVRLALGEPVCEVMSPADTNYPDGATNWIYFIEGDSKPTRLVFAKDLLVTAQKSTALKVCEGNSKKK